MTGWLLATLATATTPAKGDPVAVVITVGVLILVVVGAGMAVLYIRRRLFSKHDTAATTGGFLDELRDMHKRGEMSDEEFQAARASLLAKITGQPVPPAPPNLRPRPTPQPLVAPPGYDLTGEPLPRPITERPELGENPPNPHNPHG